MVPVLITQSTVPPSASLMKRIGTSKVLLYILGELSICTGFPSTVAQRELTFKCTARLPQLTVMVRFDSFQFTPAPIFSKMPLTGNH